MVLKHATVLVAQCAQGKTFNSIKISEKEKIMPVISMTLGTGQTSAEQKKAFIGEVTAVAVRITRLPEQAFTILINELDSANIGVAGKTLAEFRAEAK